MWACERVLSVCCGIFRDLRSTWTYSEDGATALSLVADDTTLEVVSIFAQWLIASFERKITIVKVVGGSAVAGRLRERSNPPSKRYFAAR